MLTSWLFSCVLVPAFFGIIVGFFLYAVTSKRDRENDDLTKPMVITSHKLQRHTLSVAILHDRYVDDPVETVVRVKKEFANEIVKLVEDNIEVENDKYSNHIKFYVDIWTKEAADENQDQETN